MENQYGRIQSILIVSVWNYMGDMCDYGRYEYLYSMLPEKHPLPSSSSPQTAMELHGLYHQTKGPRGRMIVG